MADAGGERQTERFATGREGPSGASPAPGKEKRHRQSDGAASLSFSAPDRIRTCDLWLRRPTLYPAELRARTTGGGVSRVLSPLARRRIISLGPSLPTASSGLPGTFRRLSPSWSGPLLVPYLALLRVGFAVPPPLPEARCALTAPFHPYLCVVAHAIGGLFSAALSVASRRPAVSRHPALWSPDFPRRVPKPRRDPDSPPELSNSGSAQERTRTSTPFPAPDP
jgi:hypothetical protein